MELNLSFNDKFLNAMINADELEEIRNNYESSSEEFHCTRYYFKAC